jgi:hypothetical protein
MLPTTLRFSEALAGRHEKSRPVVSRAHRELKGRGTEALTMTQGTPLVRLSSAGSQVPVDRRQRMSESAVRTKEAANWGCPLDTILRSRLSN